MENFKALVHELDQHLLNLKQYLNDDKKHLLQQSMGSMEESNNNKLMISNQIETLLKTLQQHPEWEKSKELGLWDGMQKVLTCRNFHVRL